MQREGDEALLGAVVEVALESPPLGVGGVDDPRPRVSGLLELGAQLGEEPLVVERETGGAGDCVEQCGVLAERSVVNQRRDFLAAALEDRDRSSCSRNDIDLVPVDIHVLLGGRDPVAELERGVSQGAGERVSKPSLLGTVAQLDHELADSDPREARLEQTEEIGDRHGGKGHALGRLEARGDPGGRLVGDQHRREQRGRHTAGHEDRCERSPQQRRGGLPAPNEHARDPGCDRDAAQPYPVHERAMHAHVVTHEEEIPRARGGRATADVLDAHEHEHHHLNRDRIDVRRCDEKALQP